MSTAKNRFVLLCRQLLATGTVLAVALPAASVLSLDIAVPVPDRGVPSIAGEPMGQASAPRIPAPATPSAKTETEPPKASVVSAKPVKPKVTEVPVDGVELAGLHAVTDDKREQENAEVRLAALSAPERVEGYATVGVTWGAGQDLAEEEISISVRTFESGAWSPWEDVEYHDDHGPDPTSAEGGAGASAGAGDGDRDSDEVRPGTDPIVVGDVDRVQVKAVTDSGAAPEDMQLAVVDPGAGAAEIEAPAINTADPEEAEDAAALASADLELAARNAPKPKIYSRAQWGADERLRDPGSLRYGSINAGFVHHTVNSNGYSESQVPSLIRGIYAYHTQSRGWSDIGYNFVVDRFGRIWEGRYGGVARPVVGAHTLYYNDYSFAMSAIGNFDTVQPPAAMLKAYGRLMGWKLSLHGVNAASTRQKVGSRYFKAINGHRDAASTACPGRYLYAKLAKIRTLARDHQTRDNEPPPPPPPPPPLPQTRPKRSANLTGSPWPDLVMRDRASKEAYVVRTGGQVAFQSAQSAGRGWAEMDLMAGTRDLTGDGIDDMVARRAGNRSAGVFPGDGNGSFGAAEETTRRFAQSDQLTGVRDLDGDGNNDLVARQGTTKSLYLYPGDGKGWFSQKRLLAEDWRYNLTQGVGDLDNDGRYDVIARDKTGRVQMFSMRGGRLRDARTIATDWDGFDLVTGIGDLTNDGEGDILVRNVASRIAYVYPGDGRGGLRNRLGPFRQFRGLDFLTAPGQIGGARAADLVGRVRSSGQMVGFVNSGRKNIGGIDATGDVVATADLLLNVGDWDGDKHGDVMTRSAESGDIYLRKGDGEGHFGQPVRAGEGWGAISSITPVGDVTGDGKPDLVGKRKSGQMRLYPGDGRSGFRSSVPARPKVTARLRAGSAERYNAMVYVGDANGDKVGDLIAREKGTGQLWLMPGEPGPGAFAKRRFIAGGFGGYDLVG